MATTRQPSLLAAQAGFLLQNCNSYQRLPHLLKFYAIHRAAQTQATWFKLFGAEWTGLDNVGVYQKKIRPILKRHPGLWPLMMTPAERRLYRALPDPVIAYRAAGRINRLGLSWSTSKPAAERFVRLARYRQPDPRILTGTFPRRQIVAVKTDRDEAELIILAGPNHLTSEEILFL